VMDCGFKWIETFEVADGPIAGIETRDGIICLADQIHDRARRRDERSQSSGEFGTCRELIGTCWKLIVISSGPSRLPVV